MRKIFFLLALGFVNFAFAANIDALDKIKTPGQAFIAELSFRTGIKIENAAYGPAKDIRVSSFVNKFKDITMQDVRFQSGGEKYVCRIKIQDSENFFLIGCWDKNQKELHKKIGSVRTGLFARPILDVKFPTGQPAEFESAMGVETTKMTLRYYMTAEKKSTRTGAQ